MYVYVYIYMYICMYIIIETASGTSVTHADAYAAYEVSVEPLCCLN